MRKKVAVVGDRDSVLVFKALGVHVFELTADFVLKEVMY